MCGFIEGCVDSHISALAACRGGADRLELCANLAIGGTTPSPALFRQVRRDCGVPVHVLIRPRFGDFLYSEAEVEEMAETVRLFRDLGADGVNVFRRVILPLSLPGVLSGITMVFVPSVSTFAISKMLGGGTELLLGDLIEQQFLGGAYNPQLGAAISLVMMVIVVVCMVVMNRFGEGEEQAVIL